MEKQNTRNTQKKRSRKHRRRAQRRFQLVLLHREHVFELLTRAFCAEYHQSDHRRRGYHPGKHPDNTRQKRVQK